MLNVKIQIPGSGQAMFRILTRDKKRFNKEKCPQLHAERAPSRWRFLDEAGGGRAALWRGTQDPISVEMPLTFSSTRNPNISPFGTANEVFASTVK